VVHGLDGQEERLRAGARPRVGEPWGDESDDRWGRLYPSGEVVPSLPGAWPEFYARVAACLEGRCEPPVDTGSVLATMRVLDAARESARRGEVVQPAQR
jgi:predicted dehydrogenase